MTSRTRPATALALLAITGAAMAAGVPTGCPAQADDVHTLGGEWLYVEDRNEGRAVEDPQPPMSVTFALRVEEDAFVLVRGQGTRRRQECIPLDGSTIEVAEASTIDFHRGEWRDGVLEYRLETHRLAGDVLLSLVRRESRPTPDGQLVRIVVGEPAVLDSMALYRHPQDIALPPPARGAVADLEWLAGAWVGTGGPASIEERWSPPPGCAMLGVSRTVRGGSVVAFEYLRIVDGDGGLVYVAQPGGAPPEELVLTELGATHAVFENPRHDSPQRIVYELSAEGSLIASICFARGGRPQRFEFGREGD